MNLRDYLEQREKELIEAISDHHRQLRPLEAELAEVRRAKGALGIPQSGPPVPTALLGVQGASGNLVIDLGTLSDTPTPSTNSEGDRVPYETLTMKQLVVKVLREHFQQGATTRQMLDFFRDAWGRNIKRENLSPQLSRLFQDRIIGRRDDHAWFLLGDSPGLRRLLNEDGLILYDEED